MLGELFRAYTMTTVPLGELFRARTHIRPISAKNVAHEARQHSDIETDDTSAHPQQGTVETAITSAPENRTKNAHFSPAKATAVSIPHRYQRAKATMVSDNRATWSTGPGCGARGRRRGLAGQRADAPSHTSATQPHRYGGRRRTHEGLAALPMGSNNSTATQMSHVIYRGHFSRHSENVVIPTP